MNFVGSSTGYSMVDKHIVICENAWVHVFIAWKHKYFAYSHINLHTRTKNKKKKTPPKYIDWCNSTSFGSWLSLKSSIKLNGIVSIKLHERKKWGTIFFFVCVWFNQAWHWTNHKYTLMTFWHRRCSSFLPFSAFYKQKKNKSIVFFLSRWDWTDFFFSMLNFNFKLVNYRWSCYKTFKNLFMVRKKRFCIIKIGNTYTRTWYKMAGIPLGRSKKLYTRLWSLL